MMKVTDCNVICFHLQVLHGIKVKACKKRTERLFIGGARVFGVPLENLQRSYTSDFGLVPCFLVQACTLLLERAATVGLFRKPGSLPRIKTLRAKLNRGEDCLSAALPYDVATLVKQFCRELPEPLFPSELHPALLKAQALPKPEDRTSALQLLSCLLPARNSSALHYLFDFLLKVSQRCNENLMTCANLATVFAPCLLPPPNKSEMSEGRLELRVLVIRTFIEHPNLFGVIPNAVMDSMKFLMDSPVSKDAHTKRGNRKRHSFTVKRAVKTVPWIQEKSKDKPPDPESSRVPSPRPGLRRSLGQESFPGVQLFRTCLPWEKQSYTPAAASEDTSDDHGKTARDIKKRSPVLSAVGKLHVPSWRRRSSL